MRRREFLWQTSLAAVGAFCAGQRAWVQGISAAPLPAGALEEVVSLRTLKGKTFDLGGGKRRLITGISPKHVARDIPAYYADPKGYRGGFDDLDPTFHEEDGGFVSGAGWYRVHIDPRRPVAMVYESMAGGSASMQMTGIDLRPVPPMQIPEGLRWENVAPDFDVELHLYPHGVEWFKRLKSARAPRAWSWELEQTPDFAAKVNWHARGWDNWDKTARLGEEMFLRRHRTAQTSMAIRSDDGRRIVVEEAWTGKVIALEPVTRIKVLTDDVVYPVWIDADINEAVTADADDVMETVNASTVTVLGDATYGNMSRAGGYSRHPGWRFAAVAFANGDTVDLANLKVQVTRATSGGCTSTIFADDVDDAAAWANGSRPSQITPTTASASIVQTSTGLKTVDVTTIIAEIVARGGWATGNDMRLAATSHDGAGATSADSGDLTDGSGAIETVLEIDYTAGGAPAVTCTRTLLGVGPC
jgi:hypothetical protein